MPQNIRFVIYQHPGMLPTSANASGAEGQTPVETQPLTASDGTWEATRANAVLVEHETPFAGLPANRDSTWPWETRRANAIVVEPELCAAFDWHRSTVAGLLANDKAIWKASPQNAIDVEPGTPISAPLVREDTTPKPTTTTNADMSDAENIILHTQRQTAIAEMPAAILSVTLQATSTNASAFDTEVPIAELSSDGFATCPDCGMRVNCGTAGLFNLKSHIGMTKCMIAQRKNERARKKAATVRITSFFAKRPKVPAAPMEDEKPHFSTRDMYKKLP